jgi:hypothetical protein
VSASEKLRALDVSETADDAEISVMGYQNLLYLRDALPQIVAVVESAETTHAELWKLGASQDWTEYHEGREHLRVALAALEEALS